MAPKAKAKTKGKPGTKITHISFPITAPSLPGGQNVAGQDDDSVNDGDDGPVSSRTRHGGKKAVNKTVAPPSGPLPTSLPATVPPSFIVPSTGAWGGSNLEMPFTVSADDLVDYVDSLHGISPGDPDLWAVAPPAKKKANKQPNFKADDLKAPDLLHRRGDEALRNLTLSTDHSKTADSLSNGTSHLRRPGQPTLISSDVNEQNGTLEEQRKIQRYISEAVRQLKCTCGKPLLQNAEAVMRLARSWLAPKSATYRVTCRDCDASTCIVCKSAVNSNKHNCKSSKLNPSSVLVAWVLLCGLDECVRPEKAASISTRPTSTKRKRLTKKSTNQTAWASGIGYGGSGGSWGSSSSESLDGSIGEGDVESQERALSKAVGDLSKRIQELMSHQETAGLLLPMLHHSRLLKALAQYLDTDSLHAISKDTSFYTALLSVVESLLNHPRTRGMITEERKVGFGDSNLLHYTYANLNGQKPTSTEVQETRGALASALRRLRNTCSLYEANFDRSAKAAEDKGAKEVLDVCKLLTRVVARLETPNDTKMAASKAATLEPASSVAYVSEEDWFRENCLLDVADDSILESGAGNYYHAATARKATKWNPGRMKHLLTEIVMLKTSLPPGIFVRHEVSRLDVMKVLIIGPKGTPYENGAFEFDFYCPENYPNSPPQVQFKTTGGGTESMNPNLYPDGKVCLSLLGTWQGEPWRPGKSTLLQVLISLQGMVFSDEPYYNEPGWSNSKNEASSKSYNRNLYRATTNVAVLDWLEALEQRSNAKKATSQGSNLWDSVLLHHFAINAQTIIETVKEWAVDVATGRKEAEEAMKAAALVQAQLQGTNPAGAANNLPHGWPNNPPPTQWTHYGNGKPSIDKLVTRVEQALKKVVEQATATGVLQPSATTADNVQHAIKGPAELAEPELDEEDEGSAKRTRSKRRKTTKA